MALGLPFKEAWDNSAGQNWIRNINTATKIPPFGINSQKTCISRIRQRRRSGCRNSPHSRLGGFRVAKVSQKFHVRSLVSGATLLLCNSKPIPYIEQFFGNKKVSSGSYPIGAVSVIDLGRGASSSAPESLRRIGADVTQAALDEVAYAHHAPPIEQLAWPLGGVNPVVYQLGRAPVLFTQATGSDFEDFPGPCVACLELSFCLLVRPCDNTGWHFGVDSLYGRCEEPQSYWRLIWTAILLSSGLQKHADYP